jgi:hypothetical protein
MEAPLIRSRVRWVLLAAGLTLAFEGVTLALRLGMGMESHVTTAGLAAFTMGLRLHHGYLGLLALAVAPWVRRRHPEHAERLTAIGVGLALSDALHHLVVLWALTGAPSFDFAYPGH